MADTPNEAAAPAPAGETVATPINTNNEPAKAPENSTVDLHGFTQEDLAGMRTFIDNNGGWDKIKSRISNPESAQTSQPTQPAQPTQTNEPTSHTQVPEEPKQPEYKAPAGSITAQEFLAQQYFQGLSRDPKYQSISEGIANGEYLKEMSAFGINTLNPDGSINDQKVRMYLDLKAQTVPARPANDEVEASNAPTVNYVEVGEKIDNIDQAYAVLMQPGHPKREDAKAFIKAHLNPGTEAKK